MWNRRPLKLVKFSKKIATKAAMSSAASSDVLFENDQQKNEIVERARTTCSPNSA